MPATLVSVNVSPITAVEHNGRTVRTGIYKKPVQGPVRLRALGLDGDEQGDKRAHGGVDMAVYAYTRENYDFWSAQLGRELPPGLFGENLIIDGIDEHDVAIGDRFRIGAEVEVEVSLPRAPCNTFAMVMGDPGFPKRFLAEGRLGFYLRVLREGHVRVGDEVIRTHSDPARLGIAEVARTVYFNLKDPAAVTRALGVDALGQRWRERLQKALAEA